MFCLGCREGGGGSKIRLYILYSEEICILSETAMLGTEMAVDASGTVPQTTTTTTTTTISTSAESKVEWMQISSKTARKREMGEMWQEGRCRLTKYEICKGRGGNHAGKDKPL